MSVFAALSIPFPIPEEGRTSEEKRENMSCFSDKKRREKIRKKKSVIPSIFKKEKLGKKRGGMRFFISFLFLHKKKRR